MPEYDRRYLRARAVLRKTFGDLEVFHVGSTCLPPALTRGIVDLLVVVDDSARDEVAARISELGFDPSQLRFFVEGRQHNAVSLRVRRVLSDDALLLGEFIGLQKRFVHTPQGYEDAKANFFSEILPRCPVIDEDSELPYCIELETERLVIRSALSCDAEEFAAFRYREREHIEAFGASNRETELDVGRWQKGFTEFSLATRQKRSTLLLVRLRDSNELIGSLSVNAVNWRPLPNCEIGYNVAKAYQGKGLASEGVRALIGFLHRQWRMHRICAHYNPDNRRSALLLERLGFAIEGVQRRLLQSDGQWLDGVFVAKILPPLSGPS